MYWLLRSCEVFDSLVQRFVDSKVAEEMFTPRRLFSSAELFVILREILQHSSLRLSDESYGKVRLSAGFAQRLVQRLAQKFWGQSK